MAKIFWRVTFYEDREDKHLSMHTFYVTAEDEGLDTISKVVEIIVERAKAHPELLGVGHVHALMEVDESEVDKDLMLN